MQQELVAIDAKELRGEPGHVTVGVSVGLVLLVVVILSLNHLMNRPH